MSPSINGLPRSKVVQILKKAYLFLLPSISKSADMACQAYAIDTDHNNNYVFGTYFWGNLIQRFKKSQYNGSEFAICEDGENDYRIFIDGVAVRCYRADPVTRLPTGGKAAKKAAQDFWIPLPIPGSDSAIDCNSGNIYIGCIVEPEQEGHGGGLLEVFLAILLPAGDDKVFSLTLGTIYKASSDVLFEETSDDVTEPEEAISSAMQRHLKVGSIVHFDRGDIDGIENEER